MIYYKGKALCCKGFLLFSNCNQELLTSVTRNNLIYHKMPTNHASATELGQKSGVY